MDRLTRVVLSAWLAITVATANSMASSESFAIRQAVSDLPAVHLYFDVAEDQLGAGPVSERLSVQLAGDVLELEQVGPFAESEESTWYAFLVDVSKSISPAVMGEIRHALNRWIDDLDPGDIVSLSAFGDEVEALADLESDVEMLTAAVTRLRPTGDRTRLHDALGQMLRSLKRYREDLPRRRVIVLLSDGKDEGSALTIDDILTRAERDPVPIYTLGFSNLLEPERSQQLKTLARLSTNTGGIFREVDGDAVGESYDAVRQAIGGAWYAQLRCPNCVSDNNLSVVQARFEAADGTQVRDEMPLRRIRLSPELAPPPTETQAPMESLPVSRPVAIGIGALIAGLVALAIVLLVRRSRHRRAETAAGEDAHDDASAAQGSIPAADADADADADAAIQPWGEEPPAEEADDVASRSKFTPRPAKLDPPFINMRFTILAGARSGQDCELQLVDRARIGREPDCEVVLEEDESISSAHIELSRSGDGVVARDLESTNGTLLNGNPLLGRRRIEAGDRLTLGETTLRVLEIG